MATGKRRQGGSPKGKPRPKSYGSGKQTKALPSLQQVCQKEQLPKPKTIKEISPGERRHIIRTKTLEHAQSIQQPRRVPIKKATVEAGKELTLS
jgi:hypothetical protein